MSLQLKNSPIGSLWFGFKVFTALVGKIIGYLLLLFSIVDFIGKYWYAGFTYLLISIALILFSEDLSLTLEKEQDQQNQDDDNDDPDFQGPGNMKYA